MLKAAIQIIAKLLNRKKMKPTLGRIVIYKTTDEDKAIMKQKASTGKANEQDYLPAIIVAIWSDECVNLKVELDGVGSIWKTSSLKGDLTGQWQWPIITAINVKTGEENTIDLNKKEEVKLEDKKQEDVEAQDNTATSEQDDKVSSVTSKEEILDGTPQVPAAQESEASQIDEAPARTRRVIQDIKTN